MWKAIDVTKIERLLDKYNKSDKSIPFGEFVEDQEDEWDWVDSVGVVTKGDFSEAFKDKFIEENFEDLAHLWFKGLNAQVDFGIVLDCVKDEIGDEEDETGN